MSKKIKCYNCGRECEVIKCSCGAEDWTCENCRVGIGHLCNILNGKKERYCIKNGKLYDRDVCVGYISEYQDETYVDMLNYLDEQLVEKDKEILKWEDGTMICNYEKMLADKDKEIVRLKQCVMSREQVEAIATQTMREQIPIIDKECRHRVCEEIRYYLLNHVWCDKDCRYVADIDKELDKIERGE